MIGDIRLLNLIGAMPHKGIHSLTVMDGWIHFLIY